MNCELKNDGTINVVLTIEEARVISQRLFTSNEVTDVRLGAMLATTVSTAEIIDRATGEAQRRSLLPPPANENVPKTTSNGRHKRPTRWDVRRAQGVCFRCNKKAVKGKVFCRTHLEDAVQRGKHIAAVRYGHRAKAGGAK